MAKYIYIILLLTGLSLFSFQPDCSWAQNGAPLALEEVLSIGEDEKAPLYQWAGVCVDETGSIYVSDMMDNCIKKFDAQGKSIAIKRLPSKEGPSCLAIRLLAYCDHLLYLTDQNQSGFEVFDSDMRYKYHLNYSSHIADFKVVNPQLIYVLPFSLSGKLKIDAIDSLGQNLSSVPLKEYGKLGLGDLFSFETDSKGDFYLFFKFKDVATKIRKDASSAWQKEFFDGRKGETKKILWMDVPKTLFFLDTAFDTRNNLFVLMGHLARNPNQDIAVLDREGNQIAELTLPNTSHAIYIDQNNFLYARAQKGTVLKKYQIKYAN